MFERTKYIALLLIDCFVVEKTLLNICLTVDEIGFFLTKAKSRLTELLSENIN